MSDRFYPQSIYNFLRIAEMNPLRKRILDCGAGGSDPKLALFHHFGYETFGIDIDEDQINEANSYAKKHSINLNIRKADMRKIPFDDEYFGFVFSYLSMVHLSKKDIGVAINEIHRVLEKGGLCYINFLSKNDKWYDASKESSLGEVSSEDGYFHSYFNDREPDEYFTKFEIIYSAKIENFIGKYHDTGRTCILDYIARKN